MEKPVEIRRLGRAELARVGLGAGRPRRAVRRGTTTRARALLRRGRDRVVVLSDGRLIGIGVIAPHLRPAGAQLAFLHVSAASRAAGIGTRLCDDLELIAFGVGDSEMVVSATPSENRVRFYLGRSYELMAAHSSSCTSSNPRTCI